MRNIGRLGFRSVQLAFGLALALTLPLGGCTADNPDYLGDGAAAADLLSIGSDDGGEPRCGDGHKDDTEQCDDGNQVKGDGCEVDCTFTCVNDLQCDDGDPCTGSETCAAHKCVPGTALADGAACGMNKICKGKVCGDVTCGDGIVTAPEECDDGNVVNGDGCDACRFSCVSSDPKRDCTQADPCKGRATCDDTTHACKPGVRLADGTQCAANPNRYCLNGVCNTPTCGNNVIEYPEQCDDGNLTPGDGCEPTCRFTCDDPRVDCKMSAPACQVWACDPQSRMCAAIIDGTKDGSACGQNLVCKQGQCVAPPAVCANGVLEQGEDCDFGKGNGAGTGCEASCKFSCVAMPDNCSDGNPCNGVETCKPIVVNGQTGQKCAAGTPAAAGTSCGMGLLCLGNMCVKSTCGDGFVDANAGEQCDNGAKNGPGTGCELTCKFSCANPAVDCKNTPPACQKWTCDASHVCLAATDATKDGSACGMNLVCKSGACVAMNAVCGNGTVEQGEDCDFGGGNGAGTGCEANCKFSCTANPNSCDDGNACNGVETCGAVMVGGKLGQKCAAGMAPPQGTSCGVGQICLAGLCKPTACGDGFVDGNAGEQCDFGKANGPGTGCEANCKFSCATNPDNCSDGNPCNGTEKCGAVVVNGVTGQKCSAGTPLTTGTSCGTGQICLQNACVKSLCGDGFVDGVAGEQCDFGMANGAGTGCELSCKFSCTTMPDSCPDANACNGTEKCTAVTVNGQAGQKCAAGTALTDGTSCGVNQICLTAVCKQSTCGDGFIDKNLGEQCEPPNTMTCDAMCKTRSICGNGVREGAEQCDDGNTANLDGCNATCRFEQSQRVNWLKMQWATDAVCTRNALGGAIVNATAQQQLQTTLDSGITDGSTSLMFAMLNLTDLTGTSQNGLQIGVLGGTPQKPMGAPAYNGATDLDWWYTPDAMSIDMTRTPTALMTGALANKILTAGPANITLMLNLTAGASALSMSNTTVRATVNAVSTPAVSAGLPPGHLAAEHLDPTLQSFGSVGQQNANGAAQLCGNVSAYSLSKILLSPTITQTCTNYTVNNSLLDLVVGGCTAFVIVQIVRPTQPDQEDPTVAAVGGGPPYTLAAGANRVVSTCRDRTGAVVNLANCLNDAAYSSYFKFTTDRVIIKP